MEVSPRKSVKVKELKLKDRLPVSPQLKRPTDQARSTITNSNLEIRGSERNSPSPGNQSRFMRSEFESPLADLDRTGISQLRYSRPTSYYPIHGIPPRSRSKKEKLYGPIPPTPEQELQRRDDEIYSLTHQCSTAWIQLKQNEERIQTLIGTDYLTAKPVCYQENSASTEDSSDESGQKTKGLKCKTQPKLFLSKPWGSQARKGVQALKSDIQAIIAKHDDWEKTTQQDQYIKHAYTKWGQSEQTLTAARAALQRMIKEAPHDFQFIHHLVDSVPRFGIKRFEVLVERYLNPDIQDSLPLKVIEDYKQVFDEIQMRDNSFGPKGTSTPLIILSPPELPAPKISAGHISASKPVVKSKLVAQHSNIVSEDLDLQHKRSHLLAVTKRGVSLPGSPNTITEKSTPDLQRIPANFRGGSKLKIGGSPSSLNNKTAGKSSKDGMSWAKSGRKEGYFSSSSKKDVQIAQLQPPCLAPLSKSPGLLGIPPRVPGTSTQKKVARLTIEPSPSQKRQLVDSRSN